MALEEVIFKRAGIYKDWCVFPCGSNWETREFESERPSFNAYLILCTLTTCWTCCLRIHHSALLVYLVPCPFPKMKGKKCICFLYFLESFLAHNHSCFLNEWMNRMNIMPYWWVKVFQRELDAGTTTLLYSGRKGGEARDGALSYAATLLQSEALPQKQWESISTPGCQRCLFLNVLALELHDLGLLRFTL